MVKTLSVNGRPHQVQADGDTPLLYVLRNELGLKAPKFGCGLAQCGACTVHHGGESIRSCVYPLAAVDQPVTTLEGLAPQGKEHPLQAAFVQEQAVQCGYCINGMIMAAASLLQKVPQPTEEQIRAALDHNLCRCGTHMRIIRAVQRAAGAKT